MLGAPGTWPCVVHVTSLGCKCVKGAGAVTSAWKHLSGYNYVWQDTEVFVKIPVHMGVGEENKDNGSGPTIPDRDIVIYTSKSYHRYDPSPDQQCNHHS